MADLAKVGDPVTCPLCGPNHIVNGSPDTFVDGQPVALAGLSQTACGATLVSGLSWFLIDGYHAAVHGSMHSHGGVVLASSTAKTGAPVLAGSRTLVDFKRVEYGTLGHGFQADPSVKDGLVFIAEPQRACVFAKSCTVPAGTVQAGTTPEPVTNFGRAVVMGSTAVIGAGGATALGQVAGQSVLEGLGAWTLRGVTAAAGSVVSTLLLALWPSSLGDGTLYREDELRRLSVAATRVRFQFRRDAAGVMHLYGIHTHARSGMDGVPTVIAEWNDDKSAIVAHIDDLRITWTPNHGPLVNAPTTYPGVTEALGNILVHPIPEGTDSEIEIFPAEDDLTWRDCIFVFPRDSGLPPLYLVFAKPAVRPLEVGTYSDLASRSRGDGLDVDHIPSQKALEAFLETNDDDLLEGDVKQVIRYAPSIAIPARVHQRYSETYGGRNTLARRIREAADLQAAVDSNFDAIKPGLLEEGYSETEIEAARLELHQINQEQGWY